MWKWVSIRPAVRWIRSAPIIIWTAAMTCRVEPFPGRRKDRAKGRQDGGRAHDRAPDPERRPDVDVDPARGARPGLRRDREGDDDRGEPLEGEQAGEEVIRAARDPVQVLAEDHVRMLGDHRVG